MSYKAYLCAPYDCPHDDGFEHDNYFGCVPKDFRQSTGKSNSYWQTKGPDGLYRWNGGCDARPKDGKR